MPEISILVTTYNFERYIVEAVNSLLNQQGSYDFEVVVIDDCSTDRTAAVLAQIEDRRFRYVRLEKNVGAVGSANAAFAHANGKYIARFDGDDVWYPWFLDSTIPVLRKNEDVGLVYGDIHTLDEFGQVDEAAGIERPGLPNKGKEFLPLLYRHYVCSPAMIARRELWEAVLPYPNTGIPDWFLLLKMAQRSQFYYVDKPLVKYRVHRQGMHHRFVKDRSGEKGMQAVLDNFLPGDNGQAVNPEEVRKIYARHYRHFGSTYFGAGMSADARRCYTKALRYDKSNLLDKTFLFPYLGSWVGSKTYDNIKKLLK